MAQQTGPNSSKLAGDAVPAYRPPTWIMLHVVNPLTRFSVGRLGVSGTSGVQVLEVKGRKSGLWHSIPVRPLELDGRHYLVALQGETQWVRNLRVQGYGRLRLGSHIADFRAVELEDALKVPVLRAYFKRWWSVSAPLTIVTSPDASDAEIAQAAPLHPVFLLE